MTGRGRLRVTVDGPRPLIVELEADTARPPDSDRRQPRPVVRSLSETAASRAAGQRHYEVSVDGWLFRVAVEPADRAKLRERAARAAAEVGHQQAVTVRAQIPGRVVRVWVEVGGSVEAGGRLLAVEAMKMENEVRAPRAGRVGEVAVKPGQTVELGDELVTLG